MDLTTLGIKVTTDGVQQASQQLDKLADAGDKAAASAEKMAPAVKKAGSALKEYPASAYRRDMESLIGSYSKTEEKLKQVATQQKRWNELHKSGTINTAEYDAYVGQLEKVANALGLQTSANSKAALSAKQLAQANRQLPMQFTDIAVSLQAGQKPFTVLLQQGSQIKDMYGGVGAALRAVGGYVVGLINPVTVAAAVFGTLFVAWNQGQKEINALNRALIMTGNYSADTGGHLADLAVQMDRLSGVTRGSATTALVAVAETGKFTADQIGLVATAAEQMRIAAGKDINETIAEFAKLKGDPVNAILELNDKYHFLTESAFENIKALKEQGDEVGAVTAAMREMSGMIADRAPQMQQNIGLIESAWRGVADAARTAWDVMLSIGRDQTGSQMAARIRQIESQLGRSMGWEMREKLEIELGNLRKSFGRWQQENLTVQFAGIYDDRVDSDAARNRLKEEEDRNRAREAFMREESRYLGERERKLADIAAVEKLVTDGVVTREEATKRIAQIEESYAAKAAKSSRSRRAEKTEEQKATEALIKAYESLNTQMDRRLFILSNGNDEAAALAYDFERGALSKMNDELARTLTYLDAMGQVRNFEGVADMRERMTNSIRAIEAEEDFEAIYGGLERITYKANETKDAMTAFADQAARNMQSSFADFLFNPFEDGISGMVKGFSDSLRRMAAELAASKVFELLANWATGYGGTGSNWINALGNSIKGGKGFAEGGYTGAGGVYDPAGIVHKGEVVWSQRDVSRAGGVGVVEAMRLGLRGYASGGVVGGPSGRIVGGGQPSVAVNIQNNTGSQMDTSEQSVNFDGEKWVVNIVAKAIGSGRLDRTMGSAFGVRRQGYSGG